MVAEVLVVQTEPEQLKELGVLGETEQPPAFRLGDSI
jgi:hypothetical protein